MERWDQEGECGKSEKIVKFFSKNINWTHKTRIMNFKYIFNTFYNMIKRSVFLRVVKRGGGYGEWVALLLIIILCGVKLKGLCSSK